MNKFNKIPIPICGLILALSSSGILLQDYSLNIKYLCCFIDILLISGLIIQSLRDVDDFKQKIDSPIVLGTFGTLPMSLMVLSTYLLSSNHNLGFLVWIIGLLIHAILIIIFTLKFVIHGKLENVSTSFFVVYVGISIAAMTGYKYTSMRLINNALFTFGLISFIVLFFIISYRYLKLPNIPDPAKPLLCIYTAPLSMLLVEYFRLGIPVKFDFIVICYALTTMLYLFSFVNLIKNIKLPFYPSYSAFTFPFVISATATKLMLKYLNSIGINYEGIVILSTIEIIIAILIVFYVLFRYLLFIFNSNKKKLNTTK